LKQQIKAYELLVDLISCLWFTSQIDILFATNLFLIRCHRNWLIIPNIRLVPRIFHLGEGRPWEQGYQTLL